MSETYKLSQKDPCNVNLEVRILVSDSIREPPPRKYGSADGKVTHCFCIQTEKCGAQNRIPNLAPSSRVKWLEPAHLQPVPRLKLLEALLPRLLGPRGNFVLFYITYLWRSVNS